MDKEREIMKLYSSNLEQQINNILKSDLTIPLHRFRNQKLFTVLHFTCLHNNTKLTELTLTYCKGIEQAQFEELINSQNKDGFTALHMASFKGNLDVINLLLANGADQNIKNATGLSMLHMAVQGDHVKASVLCDKIQLFWINRGIPIDIPDHTNQTPLICASFLGSQQMVNFLIPWGAKLNKQTKDKGFSALHVATQQGHSRIVRKLLVKGIDRQLKDRSGKTALDLAIESRFTSIQTMIVRNIHNQENKLGIAERCGLRQPNSKTQKNYTSMTLYLTLYCSSFLLTLLFTQIQESIFYWYLMTSCLTLFLTFILVRKNPGYVALPNKPLMELLESNPVEALCPDCSLVRPARSRHCEICMKCVNRYDHHCPWLSNCIGDKNLSIFIAFLFMLVASMVLEIIIQCRVISVDTFYTVKITFYYTMILSCVFIVPVMLLLTVQIYNILKGQTTYERHLQKQGLDRMQSRKASAEQQSRKSAETSESEFRFKKPLLKETELNL